jgi:hypothetical protein
MARDSSPFEIPLLMYSSLFVFDLKFFWIQKKIIYVHILNFVGRPQMRIRIGKIHTSEPSLSRGLFPTLREVITRQGWWRIGVENFPQLRYHNRSGQIFQRTLIELS